MSLADFAKKMVQRRKTQANCGRDELTRACSLRGQSQEASRAVNGQTVGMRRLAGVCPMTLQEVPGHFLLKKTRVIARSLLTASTNTFCFPFILDKQLALPSDPKSFRWDGDRWFKSPLFLWSLPFWRLEPGCHQTSERISNFRGWSQLCASDILCFFQNFIHGFRAIKKFCINVRRSRRT
jgi:hypothetical protein